MREVVIAYDLGTGGIKSSVVSADGEILCSAFVAYQTYYSAGGWQEQAPEEDKGIGVVGGQIHIDPFKFRQTGILQGLGIGKANFTFFISYLGAMNFSIFGSFPVIAFISSETCYL